MNSVFSLAVGNNKVAVSCGNGIVKILRTKNLSLEATLSKPAGNAESSTSPSKTSFGKIWRRGISLDVHSDALFCTFNQEGYSLAVAYADHSVAFWDVEVASEVISLFEFLISISS